MESKTILTQLIQKKNLATAQVESLVDEIITDVITPVQTGAILTALSAKGETTHEILGFVRAMRKHMTKISTLENAIDVCGTGGDGGKTFNISTTVAFVVAGAGVGVVKHGNRAASSKTGGADVLEALGVNIMLTSHQAETIFKKVGMVFLFAPLFHASFKTVGIVRKELGIRTIFNYIGPFANPANVQYQLIGVPNKELAKKLAIVATKLAYKKLCIVTSSEGLDEVSVSAKTTMYEVVGNTYKKKILNPRTYNLQKASKSSLEGGDATTNATIILGVLSGKKGAPRDIVVFNSAVALYIAGKVKHISEGIFLAEKSIDSGNAMRILELLRKETNQYA